MVSFSKKEKEVTTDARSEWNRKVAAAAEKLYFLNFEKEQTALSPQELEELTADKDTINIETLARGFHSPTQRLLFKSPMRRFFAIQFAKYLEKYAPGFRKLLFPTADDQKKWNEKVDGAIKDVYALRSDDSLSLEEKMPRLRECVAILFTQQMRGRFSSVQDRLLHSLQQYAAGAFLRRGAGYLLEKGKQYFVSRKERKLRQVVEKLKQETEERMQENALQSKKVDAALDEATGVTPVPKQTDPRPDKDPVPAPKPNGSAPKI